MRPADIQIGQLVRVTSGPIGRNESLMVRRGGQLGRVQRIWRRDRIASVKIAGLAPVTVPTNRLKPADESEAA